MMLLLFFEDGNVTCEEVLTFMIFIQGFWFFWLPTFSFSCNQDGIFRDKIPSFKQ